MSNTSYVTKLNNHLQTKPFNMTHALSVEEEYTGEMWNIVFKVNQEVKGQASAPNKAAAKEEAARLTLQLLGVTDI